jgi:hypothetical protein
MVDADVHAIALNPLSASIDTWAVKTVRGNFEIGLVARSGPEEFRLSAYDGSLTLHHSLAAARNEAGRLWGSVRRH